MNSDWILRLLVFLYERSGRSRVDPFNRGIKRYRKQGSVIVFHGFIPSRHPAELLRWLSLEFANEQLLRFTSRNAKCEMRNAIWNVIEIEPTIKTHTTHRTYRVSENNFWFIYISNSAYSHNEPASDFFLSRLKSWTIRAVLFCQYFLRISTLWEFSRSRTMVGPIKYLSRWASGRGTIQSSIFRHYTWRFNSYALSLVSLGGPGSKNWRCYERRVPASHGWSGAGMRGAMFFGTAPGHNHVAVASTKGGMTAII